LQPDSAVTRPGWRPVLAIASIYLVLAGWNAATRRPGGDEVQFANPALDLITRGKTGVTIESGWGARPAEAHLDGHIQTYSYWAMPLSFLSLAAWFKVIGFGFFQMRALPVLLGLLGLLSWYAIVLSITGLRSAALLAIGLISVDRAFLDSAADGRPDMQSAALGFAAMAAYLMLRKRKQGLGAAILVSQILVMLSIFTHPIGGMSLIGVLFLAVWFDRRALRWRHIAWAAIPYLVAFPLWGWYISLDPYAFRTQFLFNLSASRRLGGATSPFSGLVREVQQRYLAGMYLPEYLTGVRKITAAIPVFYAAGVIAPLLSPTFRRMRRDWLALPVLAVIDQLAFAVGEGTKSYYYLVHLTPIFASCCALCVIHWWQIRRRAGLAAATAAATLAALELFWIAGTCVKDHYRNSYQPVIAFLKRQAPSNSLIMANGAFAFDLGFYDSNHFTDDPMLGYYTHRRPDWVVVDDVLYRQAFMGFRKTVPAIGAYVDDLLARDYEKVFSVPDYVVYHERSATEAAQPAGAGPPMRN
jgi:hypothetical protein